MKYLRIVNNKVVYPFHISSLYLEHPNVSFPREISDELLNKYNIHKVEETKKPNVSLFETVIPFEPALIDGVWKEQWQVIPAKSPSKITRRQCALQLLVTQTITAEEALAMTKSGEVPAAIAAVFDQAVANQTMTPEQRILAEIDFAAINYYRENSLLSLMGLTDLEIDQFFIAASQF